VINVVIQGSVGCHKKVGAGFIRICLRTVKVVKIVKLSICSFRDQLTVVRSFVVCRRCRSSFVVRCRRSSFVVRRSSFVVRRSSFVVRRSSFVGVDCYRTAFDSGIGHRGRSGKCSSQSVRQQPTTCKFNCMTHERSGKCRSVTMTGGVCVGGIVAVGW